MAREMKDSGIEWVGETNSNPIRIKLKYLLKNTKNAVRVGPFGSQLSGTDIIEDNTGYYIINQRSVLDHKDSSDVFVTKDKYEELSGFQIKIDDIFITTRGTIGKIHQLITPNILGVIHPCIIRFRIDPRKCNYKYLEYIFNDTDIVSEQVMKNSNTTTIPVLYSDSLRNLVIPFWPMPIQLDIVKYLDSKCAEIDKAVGATKASIEEYRKLRQTIITEAVTKGLDPDVEMKDSGIEWVGEIPIHWNASSLKKVLITIKDGTHGTFQRTNHGKLLLSAKNVFEDGLHYFENDSRISEEDYKSIVSNGFPRKDDVLMCCVGTIGRSMVYRELEPIAFQRSVSFLRCNSLMLPDFLNFYLQNSEIQKEESLMAQGTAQVGLYMGDVINLHIAIPPIEEQQDIIKYLKKEIGVIDSIIKSKEKLIEELTAYRKSLIFEYVTGKKEVPAV